MAEKGASHPTEAQQALLQAARGAARQAYAPYSGFRVGAALQSAGNVLHLGCNVENASYPVAQCAERNAIAAAVQSEGPGLKIAAIAVVALDADGAAVPCTPCGACRQAIREFGATSDVLFIGRDGLPAVRRIDDLLPEAFGGA